ncbi:MAG: tetratricopeptide repeat protein, partial [Muribaculaceae bacterium]|nr:tetratricopeptide repeat protein [Muribaculaceae bacterium]
AILIYLKNDSQDNEETFNAFKSVVDLLDKNPENAQTQKSIYTQMLNRMGNYALISGDKEGAKAYFTRLLELNPNTEGLREFIDNIK